MENPVVFVGPLHSTDGLPGHAAKRDLLERKISSSGCDSDHDQLLL